MKICDSHCHSINSFDGHDEVAVLCDAAVAKGLDEIAITEHCDIDCILAGFYPEYDENKINADIDAAKRQYAGKLTVSHGIELGQAELKFEESRALLERTPHDFVLGSIHNLPGIPDFSMIKYEHMSETQYTDLFLRAIAEMKKLVRTGLIDSAAHITYPVRYITRAGHSFPIEKHFPVIRELFAVMLEHNVAMEINSSGIRQGLGFTLPDESVARLWYECGGRKVTVGSDAHYSADIGADIPSVYDTLRAIGFEGVTVYHERKPVLNRFD